jgi:hypothetical protein
MNKITIRFTDIDCGRADDAVRDLQEQLSMGVADTILAWLDELPKRYLERCQLDHDISVMLGSGKTMTLEQWFAINLPREDQEEERIAIRFAMDAQFEHETGVITRVA